jgi:hypothetical protein
MKSSSINNLNNFIAGWYIDHTLCDSIVTKGESNPLVFQSGIKEYRDIDLEYFDSKLCERYCKELIQVTTNYKNLYPFCSKDIVKWGFTRPRIQRYDPGKFYSIEHCENNGLDNYINRHLVYMTYLNDIKDGGGTEFIHQNLTTPPEKGLTIIWPAGWTHYHRGVVSNTEIKYIITGWFCFMNNS